MKSETVTLRGPSFNPFTQKTVRLARRWLLVCGGYGLAALVGWLTDLLQPLLIAFQVAYGVLTFLSAWRTLRDIELSAGGCGAAWRELSQRPLQEVVGDANYTDTLLVRAAVAAQQSHQRSAERNLSAIAAGMVEHLYAKADRITLAAQAAPEMGLLGTTIGLWALFSSVAGLAGGGVEELSQGILAILSSIGLAVSTTLVGCATAVVLNSLHAFASAGVRRMELQIVTQLGLLREEVKHDA
jgi:biopolymer transport protein ExbB/TolQ